MLLLLLGLAAPACAGRWPITATSYATPLESDFGDKATEQVEWHYDGHRTRHRSLFAPGFAGRDSNDPRHEGIMGAGMEGCGIISPELHREDPVLMEAIAHGYHVLTLEHWDERTRTATFILTRYATADDGDPLVPGVSAAVREGGRAFPHGRWVRLYRDGQPAGYRHIHDECSSCEGDYHIDLYRRLDEPTPSGAWEAELMPAGFRPPR
jgi:hypothetical protein